MQGQQSGPSPGQECETEAYGPEALLMCGQVARKTETDRPRGAHGSELMSVHSLGSALKLETTLFISPLSLSLSLIHNDFIFKHYCIFRSAHIYFMYMIRLLFFVIFFFLSFCIYLFSCVESSFRARAFSSCGKRGHFFIMVRGPLFIAVRGPLTIAAPPVAGHRLQTRRLSSCGSRAQSLRGMWDLPRPGLEPVSPALAGRFSTTAPPGKPRLLFKGNNCLLENYCPQESSVESSTDRFRG